jgi:hypothetical protein
MKRIVAGLKLALRQTSESRSIDLDSEAVAFSAAMLAAWYGGDALTQIRRFGLLSSRRR